MVREIIKWMDGSVVRYLDKNIYWWNYERALDI